MRYYKIVDNGYLISIGTGAGGTEITKAEYNKLLEVIKNKPIAESGNDYRLKEDLTWELYELPVIPEEPEEATAEDYAEQFERFGVRND